MCSGFGGSTDYAIWKRRAFVLACLHFGLMFPAIILFQGNMVLGVLIVLVVKITEYDMLNALIFESNFK